MQHKPNTGQSAILRQAQDRLYTTAYYNSPTGVLTSAYVADYRPRWVTYTNDLAGQVIRRAEADNHATIGDPHAIWYRFAGRDPSTSLRTGIATTSNTADPLAMTHAQSVAERTKQPPSTTSHSFTASPALAGNLSYEAVNSFRQGSGGGRYTVRGGETLQSIARNAWGDASLWYKIAEGVGAQDSRGLSEH